MHEGRFSLGVGSGEALNEHILGDRWPEADVRLEMLEEAVEVIRLLWQGGQRSHHGKPLHGRERARLRPARRAAADPRLRLRPEGDRARGADRRRLLHDLARQGRDRPLPLRRAARARCTPGPRSASWTTRSRRCETVLRLWPNEGLPGELAQVLPTPAHFEQACELVTAEHIASPVGPDLDEHVESLQQYADAGVDELFVQQIGPDQDPFFTTWADEVLPRFT